MVHAVNHQSPELYLPPGILTPLSTGSEKQILSAQASLLPYYGWTPGCGILFHRLC